MTQFEWRLESELRAEFLRMKQEWFFRWYHLRDGIIDMEGFGGAKITIGGVLFEGAPELVYWDAVARYLQLKINEVFERTRNEIQGRSAGQAEAIVDDIAALMVAFGQRITHQAVETARHAKGQGFPAPTYTPPANASFPTYAAEIQIRKDALLSSARNAPTK